MLTSIPVGTVCSANQLSWCSFFLLGLADVKGFSNSGTMYPGQSFRCQSDQPARQVLFCLPLPAYERGAKVELGLLRIITPTATSSVDYL